jgi:hypothetical protein
MWASMAGLSTRAIQSLGDGDDIAASTRYLLRVAVYDRKNNFLLTAWLCLLSSHGSGYLMMSYPFCALLQPKDSSGQFGSVGTTSSRHSRQQFRRRFLRGK